MWWLLHAIEMPVLTKSTGRPLPNNQRLQLWKGCGPSHLIASDMANQN